LGFYGSVVLGLLSRYLCGQQTGSRRGRFKVSDRQIGSAAHVDPKGELGDVVRGIGEKIPRTPSLELHYNPQEQTFVFLNRGTAAISVWGSKYGGNDTIDPSAVDKPAIIAPMVGPITSVQKDLKIQCVPARATRMLLDQSHTGFL
jgi:hypothetical protein